MPKEESEDETDAETHEPGDEHEGGAFNVGKVAKDGHPFGDLAGCLGENFALSNKKVQWSVKNTRQRIDAMEIEIPFREGFSGRRSLLLLSSGDAEIPAEGERVSGGTRNQEPERRTVAIETTT